jgi:hypothetical protein
MKKNIRDQIKVADYCKLDDDEKRIYNNAKSGWLAKHPDDEDGAVLCAHGAVICYGILLDNYDPTAEEHSDSDVMPGSDDTTAMAGVQYAEHYRNCIARGKKAQYATIFAGVMIVNGNTDYADEIASGRSVDDDVDISTVLNPYGHNPRDCRFVRERKIAFDEFDVRHCAECEEDDCDIQQDLRERFFGGDGNAPANIPIPEDH